MKDLNATLGLTTPATQQAPTAFAELHCISNYSFLRGASHPEEMVQRAYELGYKAIAITDECSYSGLVKAHKTAQECGMKLIIGSEFTLSPGTLDERNTSPDISNSKDKLILLAPDRAAYGQLSTLISKLRRRSEKGTYQAHLEDFRWGLKNCLALWVPGGQSIEAQGQTGEALKALFSQLWIALELFRDGQDLDKTAHALTLSSRLGLPIVAANDVHTHCPERQPLQDILTAIKLNTSVHELGYQGFVNAAKYYRH